jgi:predicted phage terminase large subunit-like protein
VNAHIPSDRGLLVDLTRTSLTFFSERAFETLHPSQAFVYGWHQDAISHQLCRAQQGEQKRLLVTVPPRHMKSLAISVAYPAFLIGHDPTVKIILASYSQDLSGAALRNIRTIMESDWYREAFPEVELTGKTQSELSTSRQGEIRSFSTGGVFTGFGADYLILDDPLKQSDASSATERDRVLTNYRGTIRTRLNNPTTARIIVVMQRLHEDDLAAHLIESGEFHHVNLPAVAEEQTTHELGDGKVHIRNSGDLLWPERFPKSELDSLRRSMGDYQFSLQFQQNPVPLHGGLIRVSEIQRHSDNPERGQCQMVVQSWDTAMTDEPTSDFSACVTIGYHGGAWRLLEVVRARLRYPELLDRVRAQRAIWRPEVILVEYAGSGIPLCQDLWNERLRMRSSYPTWKVFQCRPTVDKVQRFLAHAAKLRDGYLTFPHECPGLDELIAEIRPFPGGRNDDQVDALSQAMEWTSLAPAVRDPERWGKRPSGGPRPPGRARR